MTQEQYEQLFWEEIEDLLEEAPYMPDLLEAAKKVCSNDPSFLVGVLSLAGKTEEDARSMIAWINEGDGVTYSSTLMFSAELAQQYPSEDGVEYYDEDEMPKD